VRLVHRTERELQNAAVILFTTHHLDGLFKVAQDEMRAFVKVNRLAAKT
jgi:hypothetical protein